MGWFLIALFLGSTLLSYVLNRGNKSKASEPGTLEPARVPAGTPIRVFFGTVKIEPDIVAFKIDKIAKYERAGGFLGLQSQFLGWTHTVSYIAVVGWGPVIVWRDILFDETKLFSDEETSFRRATLVLGETFGGYYSYGTISRGTIGNTTHEELYLPNVFGGNPPEGEGQLASGRNDWVGTPHVGGDFYFLPGNGGSTATVPLPTTALDVMVNAYAGGSEPFSFAAQPLYPRYALAALDWVNLGLASQLHKIEYIVTGGPGVLNTGPDANPADVLLAILTDQEWGLGISEALIDLDAFFDAHVALGSEDFGISGQIREQKPAEDYIGEILRTIDAALYRDPETGKLSIQLIRGGYSIPSLPLLDPSTVNACEWEERHIADTVNQVVIAFTDRNWMFERNTVTLTDHANVAKTGLIRSVTLEFPWISTEAMALQVGARELKERTIPLARGTLLVTREGWDAVPGDVRRLTWPRFGLSDVPIRISSIGSGTLGDGLIEIEVSEDVYDFPDIPYAVSEDPPSDPTTATRTPDVPSVREIQSQDATTGYLTLLVLDVGARVTAVEFSTQSGTTAASGYAAVDPPPYNATVALAVGYPSYIYWRVLYDDANSVSQTISGRVSFTASPVGTTGGTGTDPLVVDDGAGGFEFVFDESGNQIFV